MLLELAVVAVLLLLFCSNLFLAPLLRPSGATEAGRPAPVACPFAESPEKECPGVLEPVFNTVLQKSLQTCSQCGRTPTQDAFELQAARREQKRRLGKLIPIA